MTQSRLPPPFNMNREMMKTIVPNRKLPIPRLHRVVARRVLKYFLRIPAFGGVMKQLEMHVNAGRLEQREAIGIGASIFSGFGTALQNDFPLGQKIVERNPKPENIPSTIVPSKFLKFELGNKTVHVKFNEDEGSTVAVEAKK